MDNINIEDEFNANMFFPSEEFDSYLEGGVSSAGYYDSSSPEGAATKNIVSERTRRDKLNQRLYALRSVVPNITKLDKASIVKDAIGYVESLHEEERRIQGEIAELESGRLSSNSGIFYNFDHLEDYCHSSAVPFIMPPSHPIELLELRVSSMGERIIKVSLTCSKRSDTIVKLCEIFDTLNLKIITSNITACSGRLLKTVFLQGDEEEKEVLRLKIRAAITALNDLESPMRE